MPQLFSRKTNLIVQASLLGSFAFVFGTFVFWTVLKWSNWQTEVNVPIDQPIPFSHQHHVSGLGVDCRYCHTSVTKSSFAGLPPSHTCMTCHSQIWQQAPVLKPVRESYAQNRPIQWNRVHRIPKYVYFDHSIHVNKGIGCTSCHGRIDSMPLTWKVNPFYMKDCLSCHRAPENQMRPSDRIFDSPWMEKWDPPKNQLELGAQLLREHHIPKERLTDCNTCHR